MKILHLDQNHPLLIEQLTQAGFDCQEDYTSSKQDIENRIASYDGIVIRSRFKIDKQFLDAATHLKFIARVGAGLESIDVCYAASKNISLFAAPQGNKNAVGEHALGMLLSLFNKLNPADRQVKSGLWKREHNRGVEIQGKTIGLIGYGNMGRSFAKKLKGFNCTTLCYDIQKDLGNKNATQVSLQTLQEQFEQVNEDSSVRVLVITANTEGQPKPVFCAGYDIGGFDAQGNGANAFEQVPEALAVLRPITICALNGSVYGGATDIVLACDLRIGLEGIEWRMPATAIGLHYYPSGLQRYIQRMGVAASKRAFLTARPFTWQQLDKLGLFEAFVTADDFDQTLQDLTQDIFALAPLAAEETKKSLNEIENGQVNQTLLRSRVTMTSQSEDFLEGRKAFAERRKPVFKGR